MPPGFLLDPSVESEIRALYHARYGSYGPARVDAYLDGLLDVDHHLEHLRGLLGGGAPDAGARLLVSGFGAGSELIAARRLGFAAVTGVEVDPFLREVAGKRTRGMDGIRLEVYDGATLPFPDGSFTHLTSSHIVEHTPDPRRYLAECVRVLSRGGLMSLEFPTRYHVRELHTGLPSFEWLPRRLRDAALHVLSSRLSPLPAGVRAKYREIVDSRLGQVSLGSVRRALAAAPHAAGVRSVARPAPGVVRCLVERR